jgi:hypothetical protein
MLRKDEEIARILGTHRLDEADSPEDIKKYKAAYDKEQAAKAKKEAAAKDRKEANSKEKILKAIRPDIEKIQEVFQEEKWKIINSVQDEISSAKEKAKKEAASAQKGGKYRKIFGEYEDDIYEKYAAKLDAIYKKAGNEILTLYKNHNVLDADSESKIKEAWFKKPDVLEYNIEYWAKAKDYMDSDKVDYSD